MKMHPFNFAVVVAIMLSLVLFSCASKKAKKAKVLIAPELVVVPPIGTIDSQGDSSVSSPVVVVKDSQAPKTQQAEAPFRVNLPVVDREFRGAWVASVANINWPSRNNLSTAQQKQEAINLLDLLKKNNFNAVVFQVRPAADALYNSPYEPWSSYLTGELGKAPSPYYDPLEFWVEEAHKRGLELHVWLNPYRAHHSSASQLNEHSIVKKSPDMVVRLKNGMYWFDPANKNTQDHAAKVVLDIVKRYDIDGVHFDDYFYPYATYNGGADFPDDKSWNVYKKEGGQLTRGDWRRDHVNRFIERVYNEIKTEKNAVRFGISPFGIWKPGYPAGVTGSSQYDELYADAKLWLNKGWVDYFTPQLYWPIKPERQSFPALLKWWQSENTLQRHLWPGLNTVEVRATNRAQEIVNQIEVTRAEIPKSVGAVHWSIAGIQKSPAMIDALIQGPYKAQALVPTTPWLQANPLLTPTLLLTQETSSVFAKWLHQQPEQVRSWVLYAQYGDEWTYEILEPAQSERSFPKVKNGKNLQAIALKAIDRLSNESDSVAKKIAK